jgi:Pentatricopeptide repeat domain
MRNDEIKPNVVTYNTLLNKVHTLDEDRAIIADMRNDGITSNGYTYTPLLKCANGVKDIEELLATMKTDGVAFNHFHLRTVQKKLEHDSSCTAQQLLAQLRCSAEFKEKND